MHALRSCSRCARKGFRSVYLVQRSRRLCVELVLSRGTGRLLGDRGQRVFGGLSLGQGMTAVTTYYVPPVMCTVCQGELFRGGCWVTA